MARLVDEAEHLGHGLRRADDVLGGVSALAQLGQGSAGLGARALLEGLGQRRVQLIRVDRLEQVVVRADGLGLAGHVVGAVRGQDEHGQIRLHLLDLAHQREAVDAGHDQIGDDEAELAAFQMLQGLFAVLGQMHVVLGRGQDVLEVEGRDFLVVDDEDGEVIHWGRLGRTIFQFAFRKIPSDYPAACQLFTSSA